MLTRDQALTDLRTMLFAAQYARSNILESQGDDKITQIVFTDLEPWLFGPKSIVPSLAAYIGRAEKGAPITGSEFYNFMWVAQKTPTITLAAEFVRGNPLPKPEMQWHTQTV